MIINVCSHVIVLGYLFHWFLTAFLTLLFCLTQVNRNVQQREEMEIQHSTTRVYEFTASLISPLLALVSLYYNALRVCMESILSIPNPLWFLQAVILHLALHLHKAYGLHHC